MKRLRGNNKGFSLVELIVVVMIMAILAVALAPQVMKWVNHSRVAADVSTYESLVSSVQLALADETTYAAVTATSASDITLTINSSGVTLLPDLAIATNTWSIALDTQLKKIIASDYAIKTKAKVTGGSYTITVSHADGSVAKTFAPDGKTVK